MERRSFVTQLIVAALVTPSGAHGRQSGKVARLGVLAEGIPLPGGSPIPRILRTFGWIEGENLGIEWRYARGEIARLPELAKELVQANVDVIVAIFNHAVAAAKEATASIPIVMMLAGDPVASGFVASLARPGGNVTGTTNIPPEVSGKILEILKTDFPAVKHVMTLFEPAWPGMALYVRETEAAARLLGVRHEHVDVRTTADIDAGLERVRRQPPDFLQVAATGILNAQRHRIIAFAIERRIPTVWPAPPQFAQEGALLTYGYSLDEVMHRTMALVDRILRGAKPADLPVEQPGKFELAINRKTARAIGLTLPPSLLLRADHVIE